MSATPPTCDCPASKSLMILAQTAEEIIGFTGGANGCERTADWSDQTCLSPNSGRRLDCDYLEDRVCDCCRLRMALGGGEMTFDEERHEREHALLREVARTGQALAIELGHVAEFGLSGAVIQRHRAALDAWLDRATHPEVPA